MTRHEEAFGGLDKRIDEERGAREAGDRVEKEARVKHDQKRNERINEAAAGGLGREAWGLLWFVVGTAPSIIGTVVE